MVLVVVVVANIGHHCLGLVVRMMVIVMVMVMVMVMVRRAGNFVVVALVVVCGGGGVSVCGTVCTASCIRGGNGDGDDSCGVDGGIVVVVGNSGSGCYDMVM